MKKILQITFESPSSFSGGGLGILQSAKALLAVGKVTYCGPQIAENQKELEKKYEKTVYLTKDSLKGRLLALLKRVPNSFYMSWEKNKNSVNIDEYDVVYIDFSRHGHIVKWAKNHGKKVCVRLHNVERDYYLSAFKNRPSLLGFLKYLMIVNQERKSIKYADILLFITEEDKARAEKAYGKAMKDKKSIIMPICLEPKENSGEIYNLGSPYILITGSLWYEQNNKGIVWFLNNVWQKVFAKHSYLRLVIAGRKPTQSLKLEIAKKDGIILIDSPEDMQPIFNGADIYAAPVFDGAGMKVKVAEALSYSLPVIGTNHAFIGYEQDEACVWANSDEEFCRALSDFFALDEKDKDLLKKKAFELYKNNYSYRKAISIFEKII